ncbi:hypothetical protein IYW40_00250 [Methylocystis sp. H4A]|uniref:hypothetical protein n=1 Tax=Methylocystis sp. H4A TaxID=2785788 RepID=UPI0018C3135C|nr:hypothetical protein [Methylocystis sp. H4A]MBG0799966.1 hypothetical protein [Methylocystis sp. H4A]
MKVGKIFILAAMVASGSAQAASLVDAKGQVWVGREKGFDLVQGAAELSPGDKVKVGSKSVARVVYPDGCSVTVKANSLATVAKHSPCSFSAQAGGADGELGGNMMLGLGGTALVGGALAGAGILAGGNNSNAQFVPIPVPVSP